MTDSVMERFAHSVPGAPETTWEPLSHHLAAVGLTAARFSAAFGAEAAAEAMGRLHDIGKCSAAYQRYIRQDGGAQKGPDHSTAGAKEAVGAYGMAGRMMAFGVAGHHGGLMDGARLSERLDKVLEDYAAWPDHVGALPDAAQVRACVVPGGRNAISPAFSLAFRARMLFSSLVDADFLETERFYALSRNEAEPVRGGTVGQVHLDAIRACMARHRRDDTEVNRLRSAILDHANSKAALPPGLFTLTVPTGGGKTLASLSFALEHALAHDLRRIVYVIPFTSIIEQTAAVFRDDVRLGAVGLGGAVLEHHASFDWDKQPPAGGNDSEEEGAAGLAKLRRDAENWDAPVVVTTAVQFFESLFAHRTSKARKLHNLARSVIVLDEAQSIPVHLLRPCMAAIDELARNYGASVILCTATQPALRVQDHALPRTDAMKAANVREGLDIPEARELAPDPVGLYQKLRRVGVEWRRDPVDDDAIAARFAQTPQMLCIVNARAHAHDLFMKLREQGQEGAAHLTTLMCAKHRRAVLADVRARLQTSLPVRLVATSLIEAGVDVSFPEVWRAAAGLQSIAQAAGRCNRSGELGPLGEAFGRAVVFEAAGRKTPPAIEAFYEPAREILRKDSADVLGLDAVRDYYEALYWRQGYAALDKAMLPGGEPVVILRELEESARRIDFPFERIARAFRLIDDAMDSLIVPWDDEARAALRVLEVAEIPPAGIQRTLQQYVVPVPTRVRADLIAQGAARAIQPDAYGDRFVVLDESRVGGTAALYDSAAGFRIDGDFSVRAAESNIFS